MTMLRMVMSSARLRAMWLRSVRSASVAVLALVSVAVGFLLLPTGCKTAGPVDVAAFSKVVYRPRYAVGFEMVGAEGRTGTILRTTRPWQGASGEDMSGEETALFIACDDEPSPKGFKGQRVKPGARRIVCMSSSYVAFLAELQAEDRIVAVSGANYITNERVAARQAAIADVGYEGQINYEALVAAAPDLVMLYGLSGLNPMEDKLRELNIPFIYMGDYLEENPLGKAEWLVAVAEILGVREAGVAAFEGIVSRYEGLKERAAGSVGAASVGNVTAASGGVGATSGTGTAQASLPYRPKVMLNVPYGDSWFMPAEGSYVAQFIRDAGGEYLYSQNKGTRSVPIDMETAVRLAMEADVWCHVNGFETIKDLTRRYPNVASAPCVQKGRVFADDRRRNNAGGNDYWESGVVRPDVVLRDWVKMLHPELVSDDFYYMRELR